MITENISNDDDDDEVSEPTEEQKRSVFNLATQMVEIERRVARLEEELDAAKKELRCVKETDLPLALAACGFSAIRLNNGATVKVDRALFWGISKGHERQAYDWFDSIGYGDLVKRRITVLVPKEDADMADSILANIRSGPGANRLEVSYDRTIHHGTLGAFIRARLQDGTVELPEQLLGIYRPMVASVVKPKSEEEI